MVDVVVVGAGLGGLLAAAKLAGAGRTVVVLEKKALPGGTSYIFRRGGYSFPMGPLSFSFPGRVRAFLTAAGVDEPVEFVRSGFELRTPALDIIMSRPLADLGPGLAEAFPAEREGISAFLDELGEAISVSRGMDLWHPDFASGQGQGGPPAAASGDVVLRLRRVRELARTPAAARLDRWIHHADLRNFLGSMGTDPPEMSMLNLALMWNIMAEEGIWFPSCGVHGLADLLRARLAAAGGVLRLGAAVRKIIVRGGRAAGVLTAGNEILESRWVVSNADYKTTFLELVDAGDIPGVDLGPVRDIPYTGSELCVYLGIRPETADLGALRTEHLFFRHEIRTGSPSGLEDFDDREIEICHWSLKAPDHVPDGRASLLLRVGFPYEHFARWRLGEKARREGYKEYKTELARKLIRTAGRAVPGLGEAVEVMEVATPLTYRDWGGRFGGSIAGWTWAARESPGLPGKLLVRTPVPGLLAAGAYSATELFLGGVPTALFTGNMAADIVLGG